jgi:hypothetical protein
MFALRSECESGAMAAAATLFENADWRLSPDGLEHKHTGYFIEAEALGSRRSDGLWTWPLQMAEKLWCAPASFTEAFLRALKAFAIVPDADLSQSFGSASSEPSRPRQEHGLAADAVPDPVRLGDLVRFSRTSRLAPARNARRLGPAKAATIPRTKIESQSGRPPDELRNPASPRAERLGPTRRTAGG